MEDDTGQRLPNRRCETTDDAFWKRFCPEVVVVVAALGLSAISLLDSFRVLAFDLCRMFS